MRHPDEPITIVVGASGRGIGPAVAERLAQEHHRLLLIGRTQSRLDRLAERLADTSPMVRTLSGDATHPRKVRRFVDDALLHFGRVDNLVYTPNEGGFGGLMETTQKDLDAHLQTSVYGPFHWLQTLVPHMAHGGGGRLIFMSATAGKRGFSRMAAFSAGKFGMHGLIESVAREYREEGVQPISLVLDGMLDHPGMRARMTDKDDWSDTIQMEDVQEAVAYLTRQGARGMSHELWLTPGKEHW